jgi:hypothetical protein
MVRSALVATAPAHLDLQIVRVNASISRATSITAEPATIDAPLVSFAQIANVYSTAQMDRSPVQVFVSTPKSMPIIAEPVVQNALAVRYVQIVNASALPD